MPHVDGLRALAIFAVMLYHSLPGACPGGFIGVDIFFVISGYLITGGIIAQLRAGEFSLADFYTRRIKRIVPAYAAVVAVVLCLAPLAFSVTEWHSVGAAAGYSLFYSANLYFYSAINYFDLAAQANPLLHLWSLGVEEQFYLALPFVLVVTWLIARRQSVTVLGVLCVVSLVVSIAAVRGGHASFAFYLLPGRAWELLAGGLVSQIGQPEGTDKGSGFAAHPLLGWAGVAAILFSYALIDDRVPFPGLTAAPAVIGAAILLVAGGEAGPRRLLSHASLVFVGKISYSLYLWHWPVFVLIDAKGSPTQAIAGWLIAFALAILSWRFIETPVRERREFTPWQAGRLLAACSAVLLLLCLGIQRIEPKNGGLAQSFRGHDTWEQSERVGSLARSFGTLAELEAPNTRFLIPLGAPAEKATFVLWGDSHALAYLPGLDDAALRAARAGYYINLKHNFTLRSEIGGYPFRPRADREPVLQWLEKRRDLTHVILASYWRRQMRDEADRREVVAVCERLLRMGKRVFLLQSLPEAQPVSVRLYSWGMVAPERFNAVSRDSYNALLASSGEERLLRELRALPGMSVLPAQEAFAVGGAFHTAENEDCFYVDEHHVSAKGATRAMRFLAPQLWP